MFRVVVQDSRLTPTSGKVVASLGSVDPHAKTVILDKEKATRFMSNGAQPSERVARLFKSEGITLPTWVTLSADKERAVRNPDKRRSTTPAAPVEAAPAVETEAVAEAAPEAEPAVEAEAVVAEAVAIEAETPAATEEAETEAPIEDAPEAPEEKPAA